MKALIQRVSCASVSVNNSIVGKIDHGLCVFLCVLPDDDENICEQIIKKLINLRIFPDENDKINLSIQDVKGSILLISQFTLAADYKKGNRPNFIDAAQPDKAKKLYDYAKSLIKSNNINVETGIFGATMIVNINNNGPFTMLIDSDKLKKV